MNENSIHTSVSPGRIKRIIKFMIFVIAMVALVPWVVMHFWNVVVPPIIGWHTVTYFQALELFVLCRTLFGTFRGRYPGGRHQSRWLLEKWINMTPEERQKFKEGMRSGCRPDWGAGTKPPAGL